MSSGHTPYITIEAQAIPKKKLKKRRLDQSTTPAQKLAKSFAREQEKAGEPVIFADHPEKMSEIIMDLAMPLIADTSDVEQVKEAVVFTVYAWNMALIEGPARLAAIRKTVQEIKADIPEIDEDELFEMLEWMVEEKRALYPDNRRLIADYRIDKWHGKIHLSVISSPYDMPEEPPDGKEEERE